MVTIVPLAEQLTSLSINPNGPQVVLAAKRGLFLLNLNDPFAPPTAFKHNTKWEVSDVAWNPHKDRAHWIASMSNQKVLIWNVDPTGAMRIANCFSSNASASDSNPNPSADLATSKSPASSARQNTSHNAILPAAHPQSFQTSQNVELVLHSHKRAVSDFHWSPFRCDIIATCGHDNYVHVWDLRLRSGSDDGQEDGSSSVHGDKGAGSGRSAVVITKPQMSFCSWTAGATAVKWNRVSEYMLASSHDTDVHVWDLRNGSKEIKIINAAHTTKIYGIDWSPRNENELMTCSQDMTARFWNLADPRRCEGIINTSSPIWRARFTPFGNGIVTMPLRTDNELTIWSRENLNEPVAQFAGHTDVVKEFVWRKCGDSEYQLVTWSKDQTLRLWPIDSKIEAGIGHFKRRDSSNAVVTSMYGKAMQDANHTPSQSVFPSPINTQMASISAAMTERLEMDKSDSEAMLLETPTSASESGNTITPTRANRVPGLKKSNQELQSNERHAPRGGIPRLLSGSNRKRDPMGIENDSESISDAGSWRGVRGSASGNSLGSAFGAGAPVDEKVAKELSECARNIRTEYHMVVVENVDTVAKSISISIRHLHFEKSSIHVNISFNEEGSRSVPQSPMEGLKRPTPSSAGSVSMVGISDKASNSAGLTPFPTFEIVKSGMVPMAERNQLSSRLSALTNYLAAKRIPTLIPCLKFLVFNDPNAGVPPSSTSFVQGVENLISSGPSMPLTLAGKPSLARNISGVFGLTSVDQPEHEMKALRISISGGNGAKSASLGEDRLLGTSAISERSSVLTSGLSGLNPGSAGITSGGMVSGSANSANPPIGSVNSTESKSAVLGVVSSCDEASTSDESEDQYELRRRKNYTHEATYNSAAVSGGVFDNVPFPRMCGATFSMSGQLVCFFSPLPHPSAVKFHHVAFSTRRQHRGINRIPYNSHPRNYSIYENYRSYLIQKFPEEKIAVANAGILNGTETSTSSAVDLTPAATAAAKQFGFLNHNREHWVGFDDDEDGENLWLSEQGGGGAGGMTPGVGGGLSRGVAENRQVSTADLLSRLRYHGIIKGAQSAPPSAISMVENASEPKGPIADRNGLRKGSKTEPEVGAFFAKKRDSISKQSSSRQSSVSRLKGIVKSESPTQISPIIAARKTSIFTVGSVEGGMSDMGNSGISIASAAGSLSNADNILQSSLLFTNSGESKRDRVRAKSVQETSLGGASEPSSSPLDGNVFSTPIARRASAAASNSVDVTPGSSFTSTRKAGPHQDSWRSDLTEGSRQQARVGGLAGLCSEPVSEQALGLKVLIKDMSSFMPVSKKLASEYSLLGNDPVQICATNSKVARENGRPDLAKLWTMAGLILARVAVLQHDDVGPQLLVSNANLVRTSSSLSQTAVASKPEVQKFGSRRRASMALLQQIQQDPRTANLAYLKSKDKLELKKDGTFCATHEFLEGIHEGDMWVRADWGNHPLGNNLVEKILQPLALIGDIQSLAMMSCIFTEPFGSTDSVYGEASGRKRPTTLKEEKFHERYAASSVYSASYQASVFMDAEQYSKRSTTQPHLLQPGIPIKINRENTRYDSNQSSSNGRVLLHRANSSGRLQMTSSENGQGTPVGSQMYPDSFPDENLLRAQNRDAASPALRHDIVGRLYGRTSGVSYSPSDRLGTPGGGGGIVRRFGSESARSSLAQSMNPSRSYIPSHIPVPAPGLMMMIDSPGRRLPSDEEEYRFESEYLDGEDMHHTPTLSASYGKRLAIGSGLAPREESQCDNYTVALLNPTRQHVFDQYKIKYADILLSWGLTEKRAELLKLVSTKSAAAMGVYLDGAESQLGLPVAAILVKSDSDQDFKQRISDPDVVQYLPVKCSICRLPFAINLTSFLKPTTPNMHRMHAPLLALVLALSAPCYAQTTSTSQSSSVPSSQADPSNTLPTSVPSASSATTAATLIVTTSSSTSSRNAIVISPAPAVVAQVETQDPTLKCVSLTTSQLCPSFRSYYFNAQSEYLRQQVGIADGRDATSRDFDSMVQRWAYGITGTLGDIQCLAWDQSKVRYSVQYFCDYFLQDPYVIGNSGESLPGSATDCNVVAHNGQVPEKSLTPRISPYACDSFFNSTFEFISDSLTGCQGSTAMTRGRFVKSTKDQCAAAKYAVEQDGYTGVDMIKVDNSTEHLQCGFGIVNGNQTSGIFQAFLHCYRETTDPCCKVDPAIIKALNNGGVYPDKPPPPWTCYVQFNRFFLLSCGQLSGIIIGVCMVILSGVIIWIGVSRQDPEEMRKTKAGESKARYAWVSGWWKNSAFSNPARPHDGDDGDSGFKAAANRLSLQKPHKVQGGSQNGQPNKFSTERSQFQRFDDQEASDVYASRARGASRDPFNSGSSSPAAAPGYKAMFEFRGDVENGEMDIVRANDRLIVLQVVADGYAFAQNLETGQQGVVPLNILAR
ncbi:hypothetical protein CcCBS67573_g04826 [Chytriomyces confervae]|uniref:SH3 domain-containing protein n=1 Tax=Chytriomyces confervae TaxID=246404 RepID=A0A507FEB3_9FUNG|nr:hypothetical protein CcCBS67573_g04826 [Chytriomyces confervae]